MHVVMPDRRTVFEHAQPLIADAYQSDEVQPVVAALRWIPQHPTEFYGDICLKKDHLTQGQKEKILRLPDAR